MTSPPVQAPALNGFGLVEPKKETAGLFLKLAELNLAKVQFKKLFLSFSFSFCYDLRAEMFLDKLSFTQLGVVFQRPLGNRSLKSVVDFARHTSKGATGCALPDQAASIIYLFEIHIAVSSTGCSGPEIDAPAPPPLHRPSLLGISSQFGPVSG